MRFLAKVVVKGQEEDEIVSDVEDAVDSMHNVARSFV
jgi:hypothetical protein